MKSALSSLDIAVIGGSITGCSAAAELARGGARVTLFERSGEELKDRGAGIGIPPSAVEAYVARDLIGADVPYFHAGSFVRRWRSLGEPELGHLAWAQPTTLRLLNWGMLYRNLRARVPDGVYRTGCRVTALEDEGDKVRVLLEDGASARFDLVVCADGYASLGRRTLFPEITTDYAGYVLWRGSLPEHHLKQSAPLESGIHAVGYEGGHGIFYFVPGPEGGTRVGERLVNWGMYLPVADLQSFMVDRAGRVHEGSLPPGAMALHAEADLKTGARDKLPAFYADIVAQSEDTYAYAICDCEIPAYRVGRICLAGDAGAFARPHTGTGALKGVTDAIALRNALEAAEEVDAALTVWSDAQTEANNRLVRFGRQLGNALVREIPDWSRMDAVAMERWFNGTVTIDTEVFAKE